MLSCLYQSSMSVYVLSYRRCTLCRLQTLKVTKPQWRNATSWLQCVPTPCSAHLQDQPPGFFHVPVILAKSRNLISKISKSLKHLRDVHQSVQFWMHIVTCFFFHIVFVALFLPSLGTLYSSEASWITCRCKLRVSWHDIWHMNTYDIWHHIWHDMHERMTNVGGKCHGNAMKPLSFSRFPSQPGRSCSQFFQPVMRVMQVEFDSMKICKMRKRYF